MTLPKRTPVQTRQPKRMLQRTLSWGLALGVVGAAFYYGRELVDVLQRVDRLWLAAGLGCYVVNYFFRAVRLHFLSRRRIAIWPEGLHAACLHGFATYMMPFRSGELTLPLTLQTTAGLSLGEGSQMLIQARLLDLQALGLFTILAALRADGILGGPVRLIWLGVGCGLLVLPALTGLLGRAGRASQYDWIRRLSRFANYNPLAVTELLLSLGIWMAVAGCLFCAAHAIGLALAPIQVWLLITLQLPLQLIPLQGVANAGNHEGGWVAGLMLLGMPASNALELALASHAIVLFYVLALGPVAMILSQFCGPRREGA